MKRVIVWFIIVFALTGMAACRKQEADNTMGTDYVMTTVPTLSPAIEPEVTSTVTEDEEGSEEESKDIINSENLNENLCAGNEEVLFSFPMKDSKKRLAVCVEKDSQEYIVYRYGTMDKLELIFPERKTDSWSKFVYSYYFRGGGAENEGQDLNYLTFENHGFQYRLYQEYTAVSEDTEVGILVTDLATGKETRIIGEAEEAEGNLIILRDSDKITIANE
jgi:hypothetical protein